MVSRISESEIERMVVGQGRDESHEVVTRLGEQRNRIESVLKRRKPMLWTIFVILLVLWLLGLVTTYTMGGLIHVLLVVAVVVLVINLVQGRKVA
jgi:Flp pilus assembly protein TadB